MKNYRNEPTDYHWYKTKATIGDTLTLLLKGHLETIQLLKEKKLGFSNTFARVSYQLNAAQRLAQSVADYVALCNASVSQAGANNYD